MVSPVSFRWSTELVARIDLARGDVPRSVWVRRAVEREIERMALIDRAVASAEAIVAEPGRSSPSVLETAREVLADESYRASGPVRRVSPSGPNPPRVPSARQHLPNCKCPVCS